MSDRKMSFHLVTDHVDGFGDLGYCSRRLVIKNGLKISNLKSYQHVICIVSYTVGYTVSKKKTT